MLAGINPDQIQDIEEARQIIKLLLNLLDEFRSENEALRAEVQALRDEINRLKGEQGKPDVKPGKKSTDKDHSSEKERRRPRKWRKTSKVDKIKIDREEKLKVERSELPPDAVFKGYERVVVQDIRVKTDNVRFLKEKYYSASQRQTYLAPLPGGYRGQFGPGVRALVLTLYHAAGMTEPKLLEFLSFFGLSVSAGQLSDMLTKGQQRWHQEKDDIYRAGLESSEWQHIDDTPTRVNGENHYCHIIGNPLFSACFTRPRRDRLTVLKVLQNVSALHFLLNEQTADWLETFAVPRWAQRVIAQWPHHRRMDYEQVKTLINKDLHKLGQQQQARVLEAAALSEWYAQTRMPVVSLLVSDDASQFRFITPEQALCWVHEGRRYKKLTPFLEYHRQLTDEFRTRFWDFYHKLQRYRSQPSEEPASMLRREFDTLFSTVTGYDRLDKRIAKTRSRKDRLLAVLEHPEIPLHNNPAELAARQRVRKRDISFGPRTPDGAKAWDTFMTLTETAKKSGVSFYAYIYDRLSDTNALPSLADMIRQRSPAVHPTITA